MQTTEFSTRARARQIRYTGEHHLQGDRPWESAWRPLVGAALLERIRVTGRPRPAADPTFTGDLRDLLESGLSNLAELAVPTADAGSSPGGRLVVTKDRLTRALSCPLHRMADRFGERTFSIPLACGALVGVLFRQVVTVGAVGDPMTEALEGLALDGRQMPLVDWIARLPAADLSELRSEVDRQARGLAERWPTFDAPWLPRTQEALRAFLAGGSVELSARVDLAVGRRTEGEASVAIVDVKSGVRRPGHRDEVRFYALVEALSRAVPPFAVATYYSRTGELDVESVTHELLIETARRCLAGTRILGGLASESEDGTWCAMCAALPRRAVGPPEGVGPARSTESAGPVGLTGGHSDLTSNPVDVPLQRQAA